MTSVIECRTGNFANWIQVCLSTNTFSSTSALTAGEDLFKCHVSRSTNSLIEYARADKGCGIREFPAGAGSYYQYLRNFKEVRNGAEKHLKESDTSSGHIKQATET